MKPELSQPDTGPLKQRIRNVKTANVSTAMDSAHQHVAQYRSSTCDGAPGIQLRPKAEALAEDERILVKVMMDLRKWNTYLSRKRISVKT